MDSWKTLRIADVAAPGANSMATGPFGSSVSSRYFRSSGVPLIRGGNLSADSVVRLQDQDDLVFLEPGKAASFARSTVRKGDLVFTCWGTINQVGLIDQSARYEQYVISNKQMKLTPDRSIADPEFLYYLFSATPMQREIVEGSIGSSIPGFNLTRLKSLELQLPSPPEQRRIAEALRDAESAEIRLRDRIAKKQAIKQGMMQQLLTGRTRLPGFTEPWREGRFDEIAKPISDRVMPSQIDPDTPLVELDQLESGSGRLIASATVSEAVSLKSRFEAGDVLFGKLRAYLRKYWHADTDGVCTTEIWVLRSLEGSDCRYLRFLVETDKFIGVASGAYGTHMPRSDWGTVKNLTVAIPPVDEQAAIGDALTDADAEISLLHRRLSKARSVKQGMMQELLSGRVRLPAEGVVA